MNDKSEQASASHHEMLDRCHDVAAVIVTYNPNPELFLRGLRSISMQVAMIVVVDNASREFPAERLADQTKDIGADIKVITMSSNRGIGAGFNAGINEVRAFGFTYVILFDQDSLPQKGMIASLKQACQTLCDQGFCVGAVGPRFRAPESNEISDFVDFSSGRIRLVGCNGSGSIVQAGMLISSGCFIPMSVIDIVGNMDESLFIDHVDTEWCLRARSKNHLIYGVCDAVMEHSLGEGRHRIWWRRWHNIPYHVPFRYYYILRNILALIERSYIGKKEKEALCIYAVKLVLCLIFLLPNKRKNIKMVFRGIADGFRGISGPMQ